jgi:hypothetical protein
MSGSAKCLGGRRERRVVLEEKIEAGEEDRPGGGDVRWVCEMGVWGGSMAWDGRWVQHQ